MNGSKSTLRAASVGTVAARAMLLVLPLLVALSAACGPDSSTASSRSQAGASSGDPRLLFEESEHDFGRVSATRRAEYRFSFMNAGREPLRISELRPQPARPGG